MGALIAAFLVFMVFAFVIATSGNRTPSLDDGSSFTNLGVGGVWGLASNGTPARGIMLSVANAGSRASRNGQRFEIRSVRVDIEPAGGAPYETNLDLYIPSNLVADVLPGSTMELRIDPSNRGYAMVIGPDVGYSQGAVRTS